VKTKGLFLRLGIACIGILMVMLPVLACASPTSPTTSGPKTLDLGIVEGISGQFSEFTKVQVDGMMIAIDIINERGGITVNGQKYLINPVIEDSKNTPEGVVTAANRIIYDKKLNMVVGCGMGAMVHALATVTDPANVIRVPDWNNGTPQDINANTPYVLEASWGTVETAQATINYLVKNYPDVKDLLLIMPDDGAIADVGPKVKKLAEEAGLTMKNPVFGWGLDTVDFYPLAQKCVTLNADAWMVNPGWESHVAAFLKGGREQGFNGVVMGNNGAFHSLQKAAGSDPRILTKVIMVGFSTETAEEVKALPDDMFTPLFKQIGAKAFADYGYFIPDMLKGFNAVYCLAQAYEAANSFDPAVVAATWKKMDTMETAYGPGRLCGQETFGVRSIVSPNAPIQKIDDGKMNYAGMADMYVP